jgi:catechol 2,3-dioxygenase-like lactoylglutathione lyase family enzyme
MTISLKRKRSMDEKTVLNHVALECSDMEKAKTFFTIILGMPLMKTFTVSAELSEAIFGIKEHVDVDVYDNEQTRFEVFITKTVKLSGYKHICIEIDDKQTFINRCKTHGIEPMIIQKDGKDLLFVKDFSGNLFEIKEHQ